MGSTETPEQTAYKQLVIERYRWIQFGVMTIHYLIKSGVLPVVDTSHSRTLFKQILAVAQSYGVPNTKNPRMFFRFLCPLRVNVVVRAFLIVFGSSISPYKNESKFQWEQLLAVELSMCD